MNKSVIGAVWAAVFMSTIPAANWMIGNIGVCSPDGPCVVPVGFGLYAPSGVLLIGLALVARDEVHEAMGVFASIVAVVLGAAISFVVADPFIAAASVASFLVSELSDLAVYSKIRARSRPLAILGSGLVGAVVDSVLFLLIAFGSLHFVAGQIVGKLFASAAAAIFRAIRQ